ncbi:anti-sigma-I factor RsgI family protein [Ornithinibacillus xuwenensis]|uniref:RsgI N-terminal anti-sigma domain-containing protein n=1 Tax=Ornithinibacillus xuwenensis TaxID=3144668 RepID=A0ABU9XMT2_9BACI
MKNKTYQGIVLKVTDQYVVLLQKGGTFKNIPIDRVDTIPMIGQSFSYIENDSRRNWWKYLSIAALLFIGILSYTMYSSAQSSYLLVIDINPSIELTVNGSDKVTKITGLNKDGENLLQELHIENKNLEVSTALSKIVKQAEGDGYFENNPLIYTTIVPIKHKARTSVEEIDSIIKTSLGNENVSVVVSKESKEKYEKAKKEKLTINYYKQYEILQEQGIVYDVEEIYGKSLSELQMMRSSNNNKNAVEDQNEHNDDTVETVVPNRGNSTNSDDKQSNQKEEAATNKQEEKPNNTSSNQNKEQSNSSSNQKDLPEKNNNSQENEGLKQKEQNSKNGTDIPSKEGEEQMPNKQQAPSNENVPEKNQEGNASNQKNDDNPSKEAQQNKPSQEENQQSNENNSGQNSDRSNQ